MVLQPNAHGLLGYLKDTCHIRHQLLIRPSGAQLIETALDLRQRQQIFSLYFGYGLKLKKVSARAGVRMERTWNHADADNSREGIYDRSLIHI